MSYFEAVKKFHEDVLGQLPSGVSLLAPGNMRERVAFMLEEIDEMGEAYADGDIVKVADAIADLVYVALGTAYLMQLPFEEIWAAVQKANMSKQRGMTKRNMAYDAVKPEGWVGPEVEISAAIFGDGLAPKS